mgnify:CR=1 FL=1
MILMDDNFATISKAVKEGRGIFNNIKKTLLFLLSSNTGEVLVMLIAILFNFPIPFFFVLLPIEQYGKMFYICDCSTNLPATKSFLSAKG